MIDVYLSYSHTDRVKANVIAQSLKDAGFVVWLDQELRGGDRWHDVIGKTISEARVVVALFSPNFVTSEWARAESQLALTENKLVPVIIEPVKLPLGFSHIQFVDLSKWDGDKSHRGWMILLEALKETNSVRSAAAPKPNTPGARVVVPAGRRYKSAKGAASTNVFVAHASADKPKLGPIVEVLLDQQFKIWIDKPQEIGLSAEYEAKIALDRIHFGNDWKEDIRKAIQKAKIVLAFWSLDAVEGRREQFHYEVYQGMMQQKLHQCRIDAVDFEQIGMPYTFDHIADLAKLKRGEYHPELDYLMQDMSRRRRGWLR